MSATKTVDRIIEISESLGYGLDINFLPGKKPIKIKPLNGRQKSFDTPAEALSYLEARRSELVQF